LGMGAGSPSNTMWPGPRPTCTPSFILIHPTVWPQFTNVTDRQTGQTDRQVRQWSDSIGRTVLQTVAQKPKMAAAAILKNRKIAISRPRFDRFRPNLTPRCTSTILSRPTIKNSKNLKVHDSRVCHLEKSKYRHISVTLVPIATKFGTLMQFDPPDHSVSKIRPQ